MNRNCTVNIFNDHTNADYPIEGSGARVTINSILLKSTTEIVVRATVWIRAQEKSPVLVNECEIKLLYRIEDSVSDILEKAKKHIFEALRFDYP